MEDVESIRLTFVGTGVSCAIPVIGHLTTSCACRDAIAHPDGPNRRNNVALLLSRRFARGAGGGVEWHHVMFDCGKTFRNAYMRVLAPLRVEYVDALLLTHGHADAMHCVEELCGMQAEAAARYTSPPTTGTTGAVPRTLRRVPTFLTAPTLEQVAMVSPELVQHCNHLGAAPATRAAYRQALAATEAAASTSCPAAPTTLDLFYMDETQPQRMYVPLGPLSISDAAAAAAADDDDVTDAGSSGTDIPFYSFPVEHGKGYISMAWVFGRGTAFKSRQQQQQQQQQLERGSCVVYISDVSEVPAASMTFLQDLVKIDVLVLDLLAGHGERSASHMCADDVIPLIVALAPHRVYFVGMFCSLEHHDANAALAQELQDLKQQYRRARTAAAAADAAGTADTETERNRAFVERVCSMELAYDGQQLILPA
ncbi:Metallo-beta-lactamase superfamily/Beta-lactamase superfamily domain containing protein [Novymonas esmeraldas]|uniref:Metallo-beta-lactamase superfamily/Beta-lactamase superfamily domain containing protein n=1 Tax=Novymonas esmeraldas TaxID=1808958 RepID=A0AAW0EPS6_9TRYP